MVLRSDEGWTIKRKGRSIVVLLKQCITSNRAPHLRANHGVAISLVSRTLRLKLPWWPLNEEGALYSPMLNRRTDIQPKHLFNTRVSSHPDLDRRLYMDQNEGEEIRFPMNY